MFPLDQSSYVLEDVDSTIIVPKYEDVANSKSPEENVSRLNEITSPRERLIAFLIGTFNIYEVDPPHESRWTRQMMANGMVAGLMYGAFVKSKDAHIDYRRKYNADIFEGKYRAERHFWDTLLTRLISKGMKYALRFSLLMGAAGFISFGSITYRNKLYYPDWAIAFTTFGGLTRLWLGPKAFAMGGLFGLVAGTIGYGTARSIELCSGKDVTYYRTLYHLEYLEKREAQVRKNQAYQAGERIKFVEQIIRGER